MVINKINFDSQKNNIKNTAPLASREVNCYMPLLDLEIYPRQVILSYESDDIFFQFLVFISVFNDRKICL